MTLVLSSQQQIDLMNAVVAQVIEYTCARDNKPRRNFDRIPDGPTAHRLESLYDLLAKTSAITLHQP